MFLLMLFHILYETIIRPAQIRDRNLQIRQKNPLQKGTCTNMYKQLFHSVETHFLLSQNSHPSSFNLVYLIIYYIWMNSLVTF